MLRPTRVELIESLKANAGLPPGKDRKTLGYLSRKDIIELSALVADMKYKLSQQVPATVQA